MPKHALFTEGSSGGKHLLVNEALPGGQHAFFGGADSQHFTLTPTAGSQTGEYALHTPSPSNYTLIAFRRNLTTSAVTRFQQSEASGLADTGTISFDAGAGFEIAYIVACTIEDADAPGYAAWNDPFNPIWTLRWPA